jgi:23S rRNA (cytosine1962-C5)-methyltransferase
MAARERPALVVRPGREKSLRQRHPWLFSGAIARVQGTPRAGDTVDLLAADGAFLARAAYSPESQIRARVWTFDADLRVDAPFIAARIRAAAAAREGMLDARHTGCRLVHGESDALPGVVVDRYADTLVVQLLTCGAEAWRDAIVDALSSLPGVRCVVERSDADVRALEGLAPRVEVASGTLPDPLRFIESGIVYEVDALHGQKTGFYLDQRDSRARVGALSAGREVLNAFCYSGGFSLAALAGRAARVDSIDSSAEALDLARANLAANPDLPTDRASWIEADVFAELRRLRDAGRAFDMIVLDPPKFAPTAQHAPRAARAYKDINLSALRLLRPGGLLATFSCSGGVSADLFQKIVAGAALDARADARIVGRLGPSADHPVALSFPEGDYLKGLLIRRA